MVQPILIAFVLALISEIADKTQLVILGLALKYKSPVKVFSGALLAHAIMDGIAIFIGAVLGFSINAVFIKYVVSALFIFLGVRTLIRLYSKPNKKEKEAPASKNPFIASFLLVFISEFGDKSQIAAGLLAAKYLVPVPIFIGFVLALAAAIGFNVFIGSKIAERLPRRTIKLVTGILFMLFGVVSLF
jgi:putative Ca2+/H+ antiporter (TMEM165/GDT1 family)